MKVRYQLGWPAPSAQWHVGLPHRRCVSDSEPGSRPSTNPSENWNRWTSAVGLRADEPGRVAKATDHERNAKDRWDVVCPLAEAGIEEHDVLAFWRRQPFDLRLAGRWEGNCDGCFLKNRGSISRMFRDHPERMAWWTDQERQLRHGAGMGATFRADREDYATLSRVTRDQGVLPFDVEDSLPCTEAVCGI